MTYKADWVTGDILTAAQQNSLAEQAVSRFADASARDAAITSASEGQTCWLNDTNEFQIYDGSSWKPLLDTDTFSVSSGNYTITTDLTLTTANLVVSDGYGIDFSATAHAAGMTSELLDDYEEGEWNPTFVAAGGGTITATNDTFSYTKVGRLVNVQGRADTFTVSSPLGGLSIGSLPYAIADTTERSERGSFSAVAMGLTADRNNIMGYYVAGSSLYINYGNGLMGTGGSSMAASIDAGSILIINATYCAAT